MSIMSMSRRRSLFENIVRMAEAGNPIHLTAEDTKRLASVFDIWKRAKRDQRILDEHPAPHGENATDWARDHY